MGILENLSINGKDEFFSARLDFSQDGRPMEQHIGEKKGEMETTRHMDKRRWKKADIRTKDARQKQTYGQKTVEKSRPMDKRCRTKADIWTKDAGKKADICTKDAGLKLIYGQKTLENSRHTDKRR